MHAYKWWLALELYLAAVVASVAGHSNRAIIVAVAATIALLAALELGVDPELDDTHGLTVERLALVLVYAWRMKYPQLLELDTTYVTACRHAAIRLEAVVERG